MLKFPDVFRFGQIVPLRQQEFYHWCNLRAFKKKLVRNRVCVQAVASLYCIAEKKPVPMQHTVTLENYGFDSGVLFPWEDINHCGWPYSACATLSIQTHICRSQKADLLQGMSCHSFTSFQWAPVSSTN